MGRLQQLPSLGKFTKEAIKGFFALWDFSTWHKPSLPVLCKVNMGLEKSFLYLRTQEVILHMFSSYISGLHRQYTVTVMDVWFHRQKKQPRFSLIYTSATVWQTCRLLLTPRRGQSWHQIGKCAMKSQTRNIWHRSGHQILPHALMPPGETYIYLFITATHFFPPNSGSYLKARNMRAPSKCGNIWLERLWELSVSSSLDIFDLGLGPPVETVERGWFGWWGGDPDGRAAARSIEHDAFPPPYFSMQTDVI